MVHAVGIGAAIRRGAGQDVVDDGRLRRASDPTLQTLPDTQRLAAQLSLRIEDKLMGRLHAGSEQASFGLRYVPTDQTVRLDQVRLDAVDMPSLPAVMRDSLRRLGEAACRDLLQDYVEDNCHRIKAPITYEKGVYGYFVVISEIDPGWPHDLVQILTWAKNQGCTWLMLDCDGPEMPELPVYDW